MKAVITGITGLRNRGVEALVSTTIEQLSHRQPDLSVNILTETPDYDRSRLQRYDRIKLVNASYNQISFKSRLQRLRVKLSRFYKPLVPEYLTVTEAVRAASVVIASGGDMFSSDYGTQSLHRQIRTLTLALDAGVPVVFLAHSIGPFKTNDEAEAWLRVARRSKLVTVRERLSYNYVVEELGLSADLVKHTADPAFLLTPPPPQNVTNLLKSYGITKDRPVVAIAASQGISRYAGGCDYDKHFKVWYQVINMILDELDAQVLLIPHVQEIRPHNDDRILATNLHRTLNFDPRVRLASADHSASEFKGLIGACDMVIAERMHAAIAGLSSGVCTMAIGYSVKAKGILTDLLGAESLDNGLLISIHQFLEAEVTVRAIRTAWLRRHEVAGQLNEVLPQVKKDTASNFDMILQVLG